MEDETSACKSNDLVRGPGERGEQPKEEEDGKDDGARGIDLGELPEAKYSDRREADQSKSEEDP